MFTLALWLACAFPLRAQSVLVQAPGSPSLEYQARLKASPQFTSPVQAYLKQHPSRASRERLLDAFAAAQKAFVENTPAHARRLFESLIELQPEDDWSLTEREVFLTGYLRLAQLDSSQEDRWLKRALLLSPELDPDTTLFPPPLVARFKEIKSKLPRINPANALTPGGWTALLINGTYCTRSQCPEWPDGNEPVRITFLSEKWVTQTLRPTPAALAKADPERIPWVRGDCGSPVFDAKSADLGGNQRAFFGLSCESAHQLNLRPVTASAAGGQLPPPVAPDKPSRFYKNPWFWTGVGVLTAVLVVQAKNRPAKSEPQPEPATTYGN